VRTLQFTFPATARAAHRAHVGVVGSGDLEILFEPADAVSATVRVRTSVEGFDEVWQATLGRFFARVPLAGSWELNDAAATPALVTLRLQQAAQAAGSDASASHPSTLEAS
jgi:malonate decarboxylase delta subunit